MWKAIKIWINLEMFALKIYPHFNSHIQQQ